MAPIKLAKMNTMNIILGSSSPYRRKIFSHVAPDFESMSPDIDEKALRDDDPQRLTVKIAHAKADALVPLITEPSLLVTADQVLVFDGVVREKPSGLKECRAWLMAYSSGTIHVVNGVVVTNTQTGKRAEGSDTVHVRFREIPEDIVEGLIAEGDVLHCAGGIKAEHPLMAPYVEHMEGTMESLNGVPVELILGLMEGVMKDEAT